jgi:hypothetical protein
MNKKVDEEVICQSSACSDLIAIKWGALHWQLHVVCGVYCGAGPRGLVKKGFCLIFFTIYLSVKLLCNACCLPVPGVPLLAYLIILICSACEG